MLDIVGIIVGAGLFNKGLSILLVLVFCLSDCLAAQAPQFDAANLNEQRVRIEEGVLKADLVFIGRIVRVGPPPQFESGRGIASQQVVYKLLKILKGQLAGEEIEVWHLVNPGAVFSSQLAPGKELIAFVQKKGDKFWAAGSEAGAIPMSVQNVNTVMTMLERGGL